MRTTLTLEDDVAARLEKLRDERRDESFKDIVNDIMRRGLNDVERGALARVPYRTQPARLGRCLVPSIDNTWGVIARVEGEWHK